jgi:hypothetical protein
MSNGKWRVSARPVRATIVTLVALACVAAPSTALGFASVRGCVNTTGQSAISGATVFYSPVNGTPGSGASSQTDTTGCTQYVSVPAGQYDISFSATHYEDQWWSDASSQASATAVTVSDGQQYSYTAALDHKPEVTGKVIDATTGAPVAGWLVQFYSPTLQSNGITGYDTYTASDGSYLIDFDNDSSTGYGPGNYTACVGDVVDSNTYMPDCYDGARSKETGTPIHVSASTITSNINFSVSEAGHISGMTYMPGGLADPNTSMTVSAYDAAGHLLASTNADGEGSYYLTAPIGTDYVSFAQPGFATQYYNAKGGLSCADPVAVAFNGSITNIDAHMTTAALTACPTTGGGGGTGGTTGSGGTGGSGSGGTDQGTPGAPGHQTVVLGTGGTGQVHVSCSAAGPCSGSLQISVGVLGGKAVVASARAHPKRTTIARATFRKLRAGKTTAVSFKLNGTGRHLLKLARGKLRGTVTISFTNAGQTVRKTAVVTLKTKHR